MTGGTGDTGIETGPGLERWLLHESTSALAEDPILSALVGDSQLFLTPSQ